MKEGRTLTSLAEELTRRAAAKQDYLVNTAQMQLSADGNALYLPNGVSRDITAHTHGQLAEYTGIPKAYYDKMKGELPLLLQRNVGDWFNKHAETRMVRTLDGKARAFLSNRYRRLDNDDVGNAALEALLNDFPGIKIVSCDVTDNRLYIKATFDKRAAVKVGDEVQAGVVITNGEIGNGSLSVRVFTVRLVCLNGMTGDSVLRQAHVGKQVTADNDGIAYKDDTIQADDKAMMLRLRDAIGSAPGALFDREIERQRTLAGLPPVAKPIAAMEVLAKKVGFTQERKESVLERLMRGGDYSPYGMVQAVTNLANDVTDYDDASELEALGGKLMAMPANEWNEIRQAA